MSGNVIVIFPIDSAIGITGIMSKRETSATKTLSKDEQGMLIKVGNVLSDSYLSSLAQFFEMNMQREDSRFISTFGGSVIDFILLKIDSDEDRMGLLIRTDFDIEATDIKGEFVLLLTSEKIQNVINKIRENSE